MLPDGGSDADSFHGITCSAPPGRSRWMRDLVGRHVPPGPAPRVLDLGCGSGSLVFELASALEGSSITGIDVSGANIVAARQRGAALRPQRQVSFEETDYLVYEAGPFDVIVSDGVLHLVPGSTVALVAKLARDLRPGGVLVCTMPYDCTYNRVFSFVRRLLRAVRSPVTDALILAAGRALHGREMDDAGLRERVHYMYIPPVRVEDESFLEVARAAGLRAIGRYPVRSVSLSQLRHRVTVFEKEAR